MDNWFISSLRWFKTSFEEKPGKADPSKITAFLAFMVVIAQLIADQFCGHPANMNIFYTLSGMAAAGLGIGGVVSAILNRSK